jgi:hypothetical protein
MRSPSNLPISAGDAVPLGEALVQNALVAGETIAVVLLSRHQVVARRVDVDAVERIQPHQQIVLDRRRAARPCRPVFQRGSAL